MFSMFSSNNNAESLRTPETLPVSTEYTPTPTKAGIELLNKCINGIDEILTNSELNTDKITSCQCLAAKKILKILISTGTAKLTPFLLGAYLNIKDLKEARALLNNNDNSWSIAIKDKASLQLAEHILKLLSELNKKTALYLDPGTSVEKIGSLLQLFFPDSTISIANGEELIKYIKSYLKMIISQINKKIKFYTFTQLSAPKNNEILHNQFSVIKNEICSQSNDNLSVQKGKEIKQKLNQISRNMYLLPVDTLHIEKNTPYPTLKQMHLESSGSADLLGELTKTINLLNAKLYAVKQPLMTLDDEFFSYISLNGTLLNQLNKHVKSAKAYTSPERKRTPATYKKQIIEKLDSELQKTIDRITLLESAHLFYDQKWKNIYLLKTSIDSELCEIRKNQLRNQLIIQVENYLSNENPINIMGKIDEKLIDVTTTSSELTFWKGKKKSLKNPITPENIDDIYSDLFDPVYGVRTKLLESPNKHLFELLKAIDNLNNIHAIQTLQNKNTPGEAGLLLDKTFSCVLKQLSSFTSQQDPLLSPKILNTWIYDEEYYKKKMARNPVEKIIAPSYIKNNPQSNNNDMKKTEKIIRNPYPQRTVSMRVLPVPKKNIEFQTRTTVSHLEAKTPVILEMAPAHNKPKINNLPLNKVTAPPVQVLLQPVIKYLASNRLKVIKDYIFPQKKKVTSEREKKIHLDTADKNNNNLPPIKRVYRQIMPMPLSNQIEEVEVPSHRDKNIFLLHEIAQSQKRNDQHLIQLDTKTQRTKSLNFINEILLQSKSQEENIRILHIASLSFKGIRGRLKNVVNLKLNEMIAATPQQFPLRTRLRDLTNRNAAILLRYILLHENNKSCFFFSSKMDINHFKTAKKLIESLLKCKTVDDLKKIHTEMETIFDANKKSTHTGFLDALKQIYLNTKKSGLVTPKQAKEESNIKLTTKTKLNKNIMKIWRGLVKETEEMPIRNFITITRLDKKRKVVPATPLVIMAQKEGRDDTSEKNIIRICAMATLLRYSKTPEDRVLGDQLLLAITPEIIEEFKAKDPDCYYAKIFVGKLTELGINTRSFIGETLYKELYRHLGEDLLGEKTPLFGILRVILEEKKAMLTKTPSCLSWLCKPAETKEMKFLAGFIKMYAPREAALRVTR